METWATVTLVLGSSVISAVLTFFITKMQVSHSDKRTEKQLENVVAMDYKQRKREILGPSLKKLKGELADIAFWGERLMSLSNYPDNNELYQHSYAKLEGYLKQGWAERTLFTMDDTEIISKVKEIFPAYMIAHSYFKKNRTEVESIKEAAAIISSKVREAQKLINKRLLEL